MILRRIYRLFVSARTTVVLLCLLSVLLLLNVALPQAASLGEEEFEALVAASGPWARFLLVDSRLGRMPTSPVFLSVLGLFFLNLLLVLVARIGPTFRRIGLRPRSEKGLDAWARLEENLEGTPGPDWGPSHVARTLRGYGYQARKAGERTFWGVKHRTAPLGFLLFHLSFFLICGGGVLLYYTRFVGFVVLSEGQSFQGAYTSIDRVPPLGGPPELQFTLEQADPRFERGDPVHLGASFRFAQAGSSVERRARVNHPAEWGTVRLLVNEAGLAPVLWLQDPGGFTLDRVVVPARTRGGAPTDVALGDGELLVYVHPLTAGQEFPARSELGDTPVRLTVTEQSRILFNGTLRPGEAATLEDDRLVLEELRYWVGVRIISERGAGLLVAGFTLGLIGLIWRLVLYRREVALTWDERSFHLVGRSEYFSHRFQQELRAIRTTLERGEQPPRSGEGLP
jgi:hypothetical protein